MPSIKYYATQSGFLLDSYWAQLAPNARYKKREIQSLSSSVTQRQQPHDGLKTLGAGTSSKRLDSGGATMYRKTAICALLALCAAAGALARDMKAQAPGPAGADRKPVADLLFILSADMATFTTDSTLVLSNASSTAQFYGKHAHAGIIPTNTFVNDTAGAKYVSSNGQWLSNPTATLYGYDQNGTDHSILLTLASPTADMSNESVTFNVSVITNGETSIKTRKGVANGVVEESITEADLLLTNVQAGTMLTDVALFVDSDSQALGRQAQTKYWRHGWGGGWGGYRGGWGGGWGRGWGWGWGK